MDRFSRTHRALVLIVALLVGCGAHNDVEIARSRLILPLPGQSTAVAYFSLRNATDHAVRLIGARSAAAGSIEIHTHVRDGDILRMRRLPSVEVAPRTTVDFAPGGHHLMVFRYAGPSTGTVEIALQFEDHAPVTATFAVEERNAGVR